MKKNLIVSITLLILTSFYGQAQEARSIRLSFVAAPQLSWLRPDIEGVDSQGSMAGYNFGIVLDRFFADNYAFCTGLTINYTGGTLKYSGSPEGLPDELPEGTEVAMGNLEYNLRYLEVPLGIKLRSDDFRRSSFYGRFGLSPQINIEARDGNDKTMNDQVKLFDLGYHLGAGLEYSIGGSNALMFGVLYHDGFTDATDEPYYNDKTVLNRLVFEIGFIF